jgi:hypothetical protein
MIKSFKQYLNEASLGGNPGIPGEGGTSGSYRRETEVYSKEQVRELERRYGPKMGQLPVLANKLKPLQSGHEKDLEKLAEKAIRILYGRMIEDVTLDIKFPEEEEIPDMMKNVPDKPCKNCMAPKIEDLEDKDIISEIQKRKIINNITQGEAVNSKKALNLPEVIDGMKKIMGEEKAKEYIKLLNEVTDIAQGFYWIIPVEIQEEMWRTNRSGMSGAVECEWEDKKEEDEDLAKKILDDLDKNGDLPEETEELFYETQPTIHARGQDFSMLIHETVKGIYELIAAIAIPEDEEIAEIVIMNTDSFADEIEDLRYGPKIASDIRDYLNSFSSVRNEDVPNLREHIMGKIYQLDANLFLDIILSILNKEDRHRKTIEGIIRDIIQEIRDFDLEDALGDAGIDNDDDYMPKPEEVEDYSNMSKEEIQALIFDAAARGDFDEARRLHLLIKESEFANEMWAHIHTYGGYPSNVDPNLVNESESFNDLYEGTILTLDVIDGKNRNKKGTIKTKINKMVLEGNSYFLRCSGDVNIVYDKDTNEFVEGYKNEYLVYTTDELNSHILDSLKK